MNTPCLLQRAMVAGALLLTCMARAEAVRYQEALALPLPELRSFAHGHRIQFPGDGRVMLGGYFTEVNEQPRVVLVRLLANGDLDDSFEADPAFPENRVSYGPWLTATDGRVYFGATGPDYSVRRLWRLLADGAVDAGYELEAAIDVDVVGTQPSIWHMFSGAGGTMLVAGQFTSLGGVDARDVALLDADGSVDDSFVLGAPGSLIEALPMADGRWVVVTQVYETSEEVSQWQVMVSRIESDGAADPAFTPYAFEHGLPFGGAHAFALDAEERVVFAEWAPEEESGVDYRLQLGRLLADGSRDATFEPVLPLILDGNGGVLAHGTPMRAGDPSAESEAIIWIPPHVRQIVPDDEGGVVCVALWADGSYRGVVHVAGNGTVSESTLPGTAGDRVIQLARDPSGQWWGEVYRSSIELVGPRVVRFLASGGVDPAFAVETRAAGQLWQVAALPDGGVVLDGTFDEVDGLAAPGLAVLNNDHSLREIGVLPWTRAELVRVLEDGSLLVTSPAQPMIQTQTLQDSSSELAGAGGAAVISNLSPGAPLIARVFADGSVQTLLASDTAWVRPQDGWLDAAGRLVVLIPGYSGAAVEPASDLVRFLSDGSVDASFLARRADDSTMHLFAACPADDGERTWALVRSYDATRLYRLDASGREELSVVLKQRRLDGRSSWVERIAPSPGGVLVAGAFELLDGVFSPGVARMANDGRADAGWGGWLRAGSRVSALRTLASGLIEVTGELVVPEGAATVVYLGADGLPELNAAEAFQRSDFSSPQVASPDGGWIARMAERSEPGYEMVRRWQAVAVPDLLIDAPIEPVAEGEVVLLNVTWFGIPVTIEWLRNGVLVGAEGDGTLLLTVRREDHGAVYTARLRFEDGTYIHTRSWRVSVRAPAASIVNGSIRTIGGRGADVLVVGCVIDGDGHGALLARGLGPALSDFGVNGYVASLASRLLHSNGSSVTVPREYRDAHDFQGISHPDVIEAAESVGAYFANLSPLSGNDQMLYPALAAGEYHLHLDAHPIMPRGVMLGEMFSVPLASDEQRSLWLNNFSGRARIDAGGEMIIGGFVIEGDRALRVLVRGVGPALEGFGVDAHAADPMITLHRGGDVLMVNDDWSSEPANRDAVAAASAQVGAFPLVEGSTDAAFVIDLEPGHYTVVTAAGKDGGEGTALLEIYAVE